MATSLTTTERKWRLREVAARRRGLPDSSWKHLKETDIKRVKQGYSPLSDVEVRAAVLSSESPLIKPKKKKGSFNPLKLIGAAAGDVGEIVQGLPRGIYGLASEIADPKKSAVLRPLMLIAKGGDDKWLEEHGYEPHAGQNLLEQLASGARNVAKSSPLIPFVHAASNLTTKEGREDIASNPLMNALDILPGGIGKVAGKSIIAKSGKAAVAGSPLEALSRGKVVAATTRKLGLSGLDQATGQAKGLTKLVEDSGVGTRLKETIRPLRWIERAERDNLYSPEQLSNEVTNWVDNYIGSLSPTPEQMAARRARLEASGVADPALKLNEGLDTINPTDLLKGRAKLYNGKYLIEKIEKVDKDGNPWTDVITDDIQIPDWAAKALRQETGGADMPTKAFQQHPIGALIVKSTSLYRKFVLTSPRHVVHVGGGGASQVSLAEPGIWMHPKHMYQAIKDTFELNRAKKTADPETGLLKLRDPEMAARVMTGSNRGSALTPAERAIEEIPKAKSLDDHVKIADRLFHNKVSETFGRLWSLGKTPIHAMEKLEHFLSNVQRAGSYMYLTEKKGMGLDDAARRVNQIVVDIDGYTPLERAIIKNMYPFYGFTAHVYKFAGRLPSESPYKAAILSQLAATEQKDWDSGLPSLLQHYGLLGGQNPDGSIKAVEWKGFNPFRTLYSTLSLESFTQGLNPIVAAPFTAMGINPVTGTANPFLDTELDPVTGTYKSKRPSFWGTIVESFIPQTEALDAILGLSDKMRGMRENNHEAWVHTIYSSLGIPQGWLGEHKINLPATRQKYQLKVFNKASEDLGEALRTGDFSTVNQYELVPYRGQLVSPTAMEKWYLMLKGMLNQAGITDVSPKSIIPSNEKQVFRGITAAGNNP